MNLIKVQIIPENSNQALKYIEFSSENIENINKVLVKSAGITSETHGLSPVPLWISEAKQYKVEIKVEFQKNLYGFVNYLLYKLYQFNYKYLPRERYIEQFGVKVKND